MRVLITAAGSPGFITLYKSLSSYNDNIELYGCDSNPESFGLRLLKKSFCVPPACSPDYVPSLIKTCVENNIQVIIPCSDEEVQVTSDNFQTFADAGIQLLVNTGDMSKIFDKQKFLSIVRKLQPDIVPDFLVVTSAAEFTAAFKILSEKHTTLCVKPATAHGSRGFRIIRDPCISDFLNKKPNAAEMSYISLYSMLSQRTSFQPLLLMEYLPGEEFSVDCLQQKNGFVSVSRRRDVIKEGICSAGVAIKRTDIIEHSRKLYQHFGLTYNANFQFRYDKHGKPKIIELNPRFSGTMELCRGAGVDFATLALDKLLGKERDDLPQVRWDTSMQRVWNEVFFVQKKVFLLESLESAIGSMNE